MQNTEKALSAFQTARKPEVNACIRLRARGAIYENTATQGIPVRA